MKTRPFHLPWIAFLFLFSVTVYGQGLDWKWQNPLPQGNSLRDVQFLDDQNGWAAGENGTILKTTNGGNSWTNLSFGVSKNLNAVHFEDALNGWVVGQMGIILKTTNGGITWQELSSGTTSELRSVFFNDLQTGWVVGGYGTILKTTNGGSSWTPQISGETERFYSVQFLDAQNGWVNGYLKTTNGGDSWISMEVSLTKSARSAYFYNVQIGWKVAAGFVSKTTDAGITWTTKNISPSSGLYSVCFVDSLTGWAAGDDRKIFKTTDGGNTWKIQQAQAAFTAFQCIHFLDTQTGWAVDYYGLIFKTTNGGTTWKNQVKGNHRWLFGSHFVDPLRGWAVGEAGTILKTTNSGVTWTNLQQSLIPWNLRSVFFINAQTGWVTSQNGHILKTTNGGSNWTTQNSGVGTLTTLHSIFFLDSETGWVGGSGRTLLKTTNGGSTWTNQNIGIPVNLGVRDIQFTDAQNGWLSGSGTIFKTSDGGNTWVNPSGMSQSGPFHFIDTQTGWAIGDPGNILKTTDGANSWISQSSGTSSSLEDIHFRNNLEGYAVGDSGIILKTTNGGTTWMKENSGTNQYLSSVFCSGPKAWAFGLNGTIITSFANTSLPEGPSSLLEGTLFEKTSMDCLPSSQTVSGSLVKALPGPYYGYSQPNGRYSIRLPLADSALVYNLVPLPFSDVIPAETVCPPSGQISVSVDPIPDTLSGKDFGFEFTPCHHLNVDISSNRRRRCSANTTSISFWNDGSITAPNAFILVQFPEWVRPLSASLPHLAYNNNTMWRFDLGNIPAGFKGGIDIKDSVLCDNEGILGLSQCTKATIYPASDCPILAEWYSAEVSVSARCINGQARFGIYNRTLVNMTDSVVYKVYLDSILVNTARVKLLAGDSLILLVNTGSFGANLVVNQVQGHPTDRFVSAFLENCGSGSGSGLVTHFPIPQRPNSKTQCRPIEGSYDPNDKQVFPIGFTHQNVIAPDTRLEYLVRFQNTGNDTAFTVSVIDTLDQNLNVESFKMGAASHPYQLTMQTTRSGKTFIRWQFDHILLPDSNTNELASNGFIQFRISPLPNLPLGSQVRNQAEIYFDFNSPIVTNQTLSTFDILTFKNPALEDRVQIVPSTHSALGVRLYPNPVVQNKLNVSFLEKGSLTLVDARGSIVFEKTNLEGVRTLLLPVRAGVYFARVETAKGRQHVKLVVQ